MRYNAPDICKTCCCSTDLKDWGPLVNFHVEMFSETGEQSNHHHDVFRRKSITFWGQAVLFVSKTWVLHSSQHNRLSHSVYQMCRYSPTRNDRLVQCMVSQLFGRSRISLKKNLRNLLICVHIKFYTIPGPQKHGRILGDLWIFLNKR